VPGLLGARRAHDLPEDGDARVHAPRHGQELGDPALELRAVERAAQHGVGPHRPEVLLESFPLVRGDEGEDRHAARGRQRPDAPDRLRDVDVLEVRPQDHEAARLAGEAVQQLAGRGLLLEHGAVALEHGSFEEQGAAVDPGHEDGGGHRGSRGTQLTTRYELRRKRKARWKVSGRMVLRPRSEGTRS
jgi:hypothetical protein